MNTPITSALTSGLVPSPMDAPAVRWGIIGTGWISEAFAKCIAQYTQSTVAAVASRDLSKAQDFIAQHLEPIAQGTHSYGSYEELVADPNIDVVYIGTPHSHHREHALLAINAGKHVLVEKAFARNAREAQDIFDAASQRNVFVMEAMWTRHLPHIAALREVLDSGVIGQVHTLIADHGQAFAFNPTGRLFNPDLAGGALLDLGVYPVAFAHDILGVPSEIVARGQMTSTNVDGQISMIFEYPNNAQALLNTTLWAATPTTATITGTDGRIEIDGAFYTPTGFTVRLNSGQTSRYEAEPVRGLEFEAAEVARRIANGDTESPRMTWENTMEVMRSMDTIRDQIGLVYPGE